MQKNNMNNNNIYGWLLFIPPTEDNVIEKHAYKSF
jgi:hypothetical protein